MGLGSETLWDKVRREKKRGARVRKGDKANQQAIVYLVYATIVCPENI
jgi:hypothetical protein